MRGGAWCHRLALGNRAPGPAAQRPTSGGTRPGAPMPAGNSRRRWFDHRADRDNLQESEGGDMPETLVWAARPARQPSEDVRRARRLPPVRHEVAFDLLDELEPSSVDLVFTFPPYCGPRTHGHDHNGRIFAQWAWTGSAIGGPGVRVVLRSCGSRRTGAVPTVACGPHRPNPGESASRAKADGSIWFELAERSAQAARAYVRRAHHALEQVEPQAH